MRTRRPLVVALTTAVVGLGLFVLALRGGWFGPDVGRGASFCEAAHPGLVRQPVNTWSNLGFVLAGVAVAGYAVDRLRLGLTLGARPGLATAYAVLVVTLGPASMAMHATGAELGGHLDQLSMFLVASFAASYATMRLARRGPWFLAVAFPVGVVWCEAVRAHVVPFPHLALLGRGGNAAFGVLLLLALALEVSVARRRRDTRQDVRYAVGAVLALGASFAVWTQGQVGHSWCVPDSVWQWHGVWHVGCSVAAYLLFRHYAAERPA